VSSFSVAAVVAAVLDNNTKVEGLAEDLMILAAGRCQTMIFHFNGLRPPQSRLL
jgi:hypothetical protein